MTVARSSVNNSTASAGSRAIATAFLAMFGLAIGGVASIAVASSDAGSFVAHRHAHVANNRSADGTAFGGGADPFAIDAVRSSLAAAWVRLRSARPAR